MPRRRDWYARYMCIEGNRQYKYRLKHYSPPSEFGYKDIIPLWKAEKWDPQTLIRRYKQAGAKYCVALGCHHGNFACWNSKNHRWNSVNFGPKKDILGLCRRAALQEGLRFGVTEHIAYSWNWFNVNKGADSTGPYAGVPHDGNDSKNQDFYQEAHDETVPHYPIHQPEVFQQRRFDRMAVNRHAIHAARPWKVHGERPTVVTAGKLLNDQRKPFTTLDIRFTTKGNALYAICLGEPEPDITVPSLGGATGLWTKPATLVRVLGSDTKLKWKREAGHL